MSAQKKQPKSLNKIHRRKNDQIQKQFTCTEENCQKAYGSYAALYTHIKNKHANAKLPQMKQNAPKNKSGKKGRPQAKQIIESVKNQSSSGRQVECKLCQSAQCVCLQEYDSSQKNKTIQIMSNQDFIAFINEIGNLSIDDKFTWVRNTEQQYQFLTQNDIQKMITQFNKNNQGNQVKFSQKVIQFFSFSSRYWDKKLIKQLYNALFIMRSKKGRKQILQRFQSQKQQFSHMIQCANIKRQQFDQVSNTIKQL